MKFFQLLHQRETLIRQAHLANVAFAYQRLGDFGARIARAGLRGEVTLRTADSAVDLPELLAHDFNQSVIEEHFLDEDVFDLEAILKFLGEIDGKNDVTFRLEDLENRFRPALRRELEQEGVQLDRDKPHAEDSNRGRI